MKERTSTAVQMRTLAAFPRINRIEMAEWEVGERGLHSPHLGLHTSEASS